MGEVLSVDLEILNRKGLHARASAKFVKTLGDRAANVMVTKGGSSVGGASIMGLMMLGAAKGDTIHIEVFGEEAASVFEDLKALVNDKFGEAE